MNPRRFGVERVGTGTPTAPRPVPLLFFSFLCKGPRLCVWGYYTPRHRRAPCSVRPAHPVSQGPRMCVIRPAIQRPARSALTITEPDALAVRSHKLNVSLHI